MDAEVRSPGMEFDRFGYIMTSAGTLPLFYIALNPLPESTATPVHRFSVAAERAFRARYRACGC